MDGGKRVVATPVEAAKVCRLDGVPIRLHLKCWRCHALLGTAHEEAAAPIAQMGMCRRCWRDFDGFLRAYAHGAAAAAAPVDEYLTTAEAAARLKRRPKWIREQVKLGRLTAKLAAETLTPQGRRWLIPRAAVDQLLERPSGGQPG